MIKKLLKVFSFFLGFCIINFSIEKENSNTELLTNEKIELEGSKYFLGLAVLKIMEKMKNVIINKKNLELTFSENPNLKEINAAINMEDLTLNRGKAFLSFYNIKVFFLKSFILGFFLKPSSLKTIFFLVFINLFIGLEIIYFFFYQPQTILIVLFFLKSFIIAGNLCFYSKETWYVNTFFIIYLCISTNVSAVPESIKKKIENFKIENIKKIIKILFPEYIYSITIILLSTAVIVAYMLVTKSAMEQTALNLQLKINVNREIKKYILNISMSFFTTSIVCLFSLGFVNTKNRHIDFDIENLDLNRAELNRRRDNLYLNLRAGLNNIFLELHNNIHDDNVDREAMEMINRGNIVENHIEGSENNTNNSYNGDGDNLYQAHYETSDDEPGVFDSVNESIFGN